MLHAIYSTSTYLNIYHGFQVCLFGNGSKLQIQNWNETFLLKYWYNLLQELYTCSHKTTYIREYNYRYLLRIINDVFNTMTMRLPLFKVIVIQSKSHKNCHYIHVCVYINKSPYLTWKCAQISVLRSEQFSESVAWRKLSTLRKR